jgi:GNAT superfamily N-acetyltransferase
MDSIRRAHPSDLDRLIELHRAFCALDAHPFDADRAATAFGPLLDNDDHGVVWVIERPAAYAVLTWGWSIEAGGREAVLDEIFVTERGAGIGSQLIAHVLSDARRRNVTRVVLETERANARVRGLYERHGFCVDDSIWLSLDFVELS